MKFISQMPLARERSRFHFAAVLLAAWPQLASGAAKIAKWSAPGTNYRGPPFHQAIPICDSITYRLRKPHITRRLLTLRPVLSRSPCGLPDADGGSPRSTAAGLRRRAALQAHQCWPRRGRNGTNERQPPFPPPSNLELLPRRRRHDLRRQRPRRLSRRRCRRRWRASPGASRLGRRCATAGHLGARDAGCASVARAARRHVR